MLAGFLLNRLEKQAEPVVRFDPHRCLRSRLSSNTCDRCMTSCRSGALRLSGRQVVFAPERCTGCMSCVAECPNDAFACGFDLSSLPRTLRDSKGAGPILLSCGQPGGDDKQITVPCLGLLSEPVLAALVASTPRELLLDTRRCAACDNSHVPALLEERIQGLIHATGRSSVPKIRCATEDKKVDAGRGTERRSLLRLVGNTIRDLGKEASSSLVASDQQKATAGEGGKTPVLTSRLLLDTLDLLREDAGPGREALLTYLYSLEASETCDLCPLCTGMCPTGALFRRTDGSEKALVFTGVRCSGCGLCVAFCRKKALTLRRGTTDTSDALLAIA